MQGVFNGRPPKPKYSNTWAVDDLLRLIKTLGTNDILSIKDLTLKLTMLLALTTECRGSELRGIDLNFIVDKGDHIMFQLTGLTLQNPKGQVSLMALHSYEVDPDIDVVSCLRLYMEVPKHFRISPEQKWVGVKVDQGLLQQGRYQF